MKNTAKSIVLQMITAMLMIMLIVGPAWALTIEQILNASYDSTGKTLKMSLSSVSPTETSALTNTAAYPLTVKHESTGTVASGIGVGIDFQQEVTASTVSAMKIAAIAADVGATHDFDFYLYLAKAGAAPTQALRVGSTGIMYLINNETLDNTVDGTITMDAILGLTNGGFFDNSSNGTVKVDEPSSATNTAVNILTVDHTTSGTATTGIGTGIAFQNEDASGGKQVNMSLQTVATDATAASEDNDFVVNLIDAGSLGERFRIDSDGLMTLKNAGTIDNTNNGTMSIDEPSAATNSAVNILTVAHSTSGTAAAGMGTGIAFKSEDDGGATQVGMSIQAVMTDATAASEDYDFVLNVMDAGSAAAEVMRVTSDGVLTLENAATFDNTTNGTVTITEPVISLQGTLKTKACTIADGDATPDMSAGCTILNTSSNTAPLEITDLDNPTVGAIYILVGTSATNPPTITDGGYFALSAGWTGSVDETLTLYVQADNDYIELTRSTN